MILAHRGNPEVLQVRHLVLGILAILIFASASYAGVVRFVVGSATIVVLAAGCRMIGRLAIVTRRTVTLLASGFGLDR